jgi:hypothetical protein
VATLVSGFFCFVLMLRQRADQRMTDGICDGLQHGRALNRVIYDQGVSH